MIGLNHYVGEVLDEKYRLETLLGQGGMGRRLSRHSSRH